MTDAAGLAGFAESHSQYAIPDRNYETDERVAERAVGCFSTPNNATAILRGKAFSHPCCTLHSNMGIFYPWDTAVRHSAGTVRVNLLLNRASPWVGVESHLPYEGKRVVRNKTARKLLVRLPVWADKRPLSAR